MKILAITLETMARMALFTAVMAMSVRYLAQRQRPVTARQQPKQPPA
ncbi:MAG: hypothetical protein OER56_07865 [Hyphomicrobiales bacterium]|nr:hypothetical protein [Hyphomicrobiales bacterium]